MSTATATNGAATEAAFAAIANAFGSNNPLAASAQGAAGSLRQAGESWIEQSRQLVLRSLDAFDATVHAYVELTRSVAGAVRMADLAMGQAERFAGMTSDVAAMYSHAARDLLSK